MEKKAINSAEELGVLLDDSSAPAARITYELLQNITNGFSTKHASGGYGDVYLGEFGKKKMVAVKEIVYKGIGGVGTHDLVSREVACFVKAKHANIARLVGYCLDVTTDMALDTNGVETLTGSPKRYLCLEYAPNGDLQKYIEGPTGDNWRTYYQIIMGICRGLECIHGNHIIHLDLKPKNILLDAYMQTKITDFGLSQYLPEGKSTSTVKLTSGTRGFMAPEMGTRDEISYKSDIYALGITIALLLMRKTTEIDVDQWFEESLAAQDCPEEKRSFINIARGCMKDDPNERNTLRETIDQLEKMGLKELKTDDSEEVLKVVPHEISFDPKNVASSTLNLVNRTGQYVAYKISSGSGEELRRGKIGPRSTHTIVVMPKDASESFLVQSTVVTKFIKEAAFPADMFTIKLEGRKTYEVSVDVKPPPEPESSEGSSDRSLSSAEGARGGTRSQVLARSSEPLGVKPTKLHFPFEPKKLIPCSVHLINNTNEKVAFKLRKMYGPFDEPLSISNVFMLPLLGIVPPRTIYTLVVTAIDREKIRTENPPAALRRAKQKVGATSSLTLESMPMRNLCDSDNTLLSEAHINSFMDNTSDVASLFNLVPSSNMHAVTLEAHDSESKANSEPEMSDGIKIISVMKTTSESAKDASSIDANPTESWIVITTPINDGTVQILHYDNHGPQKPMSSFRVMKKGSVLVTKFIAREKWVLFSGDDGIIHVYSNGSQINFIKKFGHGSSHVRSLAVHPKSTYLLSACARTGVIELWDWEKDWNFKRSFGQESSFGVSQVVFNSNPVDANKFASASDDNTVKLWDLDYLECSHTLFGHQDKVNCLDFFTAGGQQYHLITGSDDKTAKIWDIQKLTCVHTLEGFMSPVVCVFAHPYLQVLITGTKEGIVHVWSSTDYRLKRIFNIGCNGEVVSLALACSEGSKRVVIGQKKAVSIMDFGDEDDVKKGKKELETRGFCELGASNRDDRAYSPAASLEHLGLRGNNSSQIRLHGPLASQSSLASSSVAAALATSSEGRSSVQAIKEIDRLLSKVYTLAREMPTTAQRLSSISHIFTGHGPFAQAVQEATDYDVAVLESLKMAIADMKGGFTNLGKKQNEICMEFEKKAVLMERKPNQQDDVVDFAAVDEVNGAGQYGYARAPNYEEEAKDTEESLSSMNDNESANYVSSPESPPQDYSDDDTSESGAANDKIIYADEPAALADQDAAATDQDEGDVMIVKA